LLDWPPESGLALASSSLRCGRFEVLPQQRQLRVDGQAVPVGARAFDVLLALIEHRGRVVSKNELLDLAWPGLVVEEGNLKVQVSALRKLIGPQAIATIPARGYRFALALDDDQPAPTDPTAPEPPLDGAGALIGRDDDLLGLRPHWPWRPCGRPARPLPTAWPMSNWPP
jgi:DNA-binding winged helix-turn-helix (wHTH) protein